MENSSPTVYVLHPSADIRKSMKSTLENFGLTTVIFEDVKEMLAETLKAKPDMFIIDADPVRFPGGLPLLKVLRERLEFQNPIFVTCDKGKTDLMRKIMDLKATDCLAMPIERNYLAARLHRYAQTAAIAAGKTHYEELPGLGGPAKLTVTGHIAEIDELGMRLVGGLLPPKGATYRLDCPLLDEIYGSKVQPIATVISTEFIKENEIFSVYLEFEENAPLLQAIRRWLASQPEA